MNRIVISIITAVLILSFVGCGNTAKKEDMYIEKAQLSKSEENIANLLGYNNDYLIYDFKLENNVKSIQVNTYELINGVWKSVSGRGGQTFTDDKGRLALSFENIGEGLRIAIQSENRSGATEYIAEPIGDFTGMSRATSILNDLTEISYEEEIPLVLQILTTKNSFSTYEVDYFFTPEQYEKDGYEHIYAITIRFSKKTVGELIINQ